MKSTWKKIITFIGSFILVFIFIGFIALSVIRAIGKKEILREEANYQPSLETIETLEADEEEKSHWEEGWVKYKDKIYSYNDDLITFLIMGIDKNGKVKEVAQGTNGGQADALFLVVLDSAKGDFKVIAINRNAMADVDIYDGNGEYVSTTKAQISVQHGFGDGVEKSCQYQTAAVSRMFYNMPIHGYAAFNMKAVEIINDTVGGVSLEAVSDVYGKYDEKIINKGEQVELDGYKAYWYVRDRDTNEFASADDRLLRQRQYISCLLNKTKSCIRSDASIISKLYNNVMPYMNTNITAEELAYLIPSVTSYNFDVESIISLEGETVEGDRFEEFNVDEDALYDLIINTFYEEVIIN